MQGVGSRSALLGWSFHPATSVASLVPGYILAGYGWVLEATTLFRQGQSCPSGTTWVSTVLCLAFPSGMDLGALYLQFDGFSEHDGAAGLRGIVGDQPQM